VRRTFLLALALLAIGCGGGWRDLSGAEIKALISGSTSTGYQDLYSYSFRRVYDPAGTFKSINSNSTTPRTGRWWISGNQECIRWDDQGQDLCRYIATDGQGHYKKELVDHGGRRKLVVTYYTFVGPDGRNREVISSSGSDEYEIGDYTFDLATVLAIAVPIVIVGFIFAFVLLILLLRGKNDPGSLRNRLKRRFSTLKAGGQSYRWGTIASGPPQLLDQFTYGSAADKQFMQVFWAFDLMQKQARGDSNAAWRRLWMCLSSLPDDTIVEAFGAVLHTVVDPKALVQAFSADLRFCYLMGKAYSAKAGTAQRDAAHFPQLKEGALACLGHVRERAGAPPPDLAPAQGAPYRGAWPAAVDYAALAAPAFETMMYMQLIAPAVTKHHHGSASVGGG
jgi:hypothetical protein